MRTKIAKQYANGLFRLALELNAIDIIHDDLATIVETVDEHSDVKHFLNLPRIPIHKKKDLVDSLYNVLLKTVNPDKKDHRTVVVDFIKLLLDKGRMLHLPQIFDEFEHLMRVYRDIVLAHVTTAVELAEDLEQKLIKKLESLTGKHIELKKEVDPGILGGVVLRIQDLQVDGSVSSGLGRLRENILAAKAV